MRERQWLYRPATVELVRVASPDDVGPHAEPGNRAPAVELRHAGHVQLSTIHHRVRGLLERRSGR